MRVRVPHVYILMAVAVFDGACFASHPLVIVVTVIVLAVAGMVSSKMK